MHGGPLEETMNCGTRNIQSLKGSNQTKRMCNYRMFKALLMGQGILETSDCCLEWRSDPTHIGL